jgi:hypothetical protein
MSPLRESSPVQADSLWLEVRLGEGTELFELRADDEGAITVGSDFRAHLRLGHSGVAPIAFHFERDDGAVYVVPDYQTAIRVNAHAVRARTRLRSAALIELNGVAIDVRVLDEKPHDSVPFKPGTTEQHVRSYQVDQPLSSATVRYPVPGLDEIEQELGMATLEIPATRDGELGRDTVALEPPCTERMPRPPEPPSGGALRERTLVMERPARVAPRTAEPSPVESGVLQRTLPLPPPASPPLDQSPMRTVLRSPERAQFLETMIQGSMVEPPEPAPLRAAPEPSRAIVPIPVLSLSVAPAMTLPSADTDSCPKTPKTDIRPAPAPKADAPKPAAERFEPAPAAPRVHMEVKGTAGNVSPSLSEATTSFEAIQLPPAPSAPESVSPTAPEALKPPSATAKASSKKKPSLLAQLGLRVQKRPAPALAAALGVALVLGFVIAGISNLLGPSKSSIAPSASSSRPPSSAPKSSSAPDASAARAAAPAPGLVVSSLPVAPASRSPSKTATPRGKTRPPADPELAAAVAHLSAARYGDAAAAYARLSSRPNSQPLATLTSLLERAASDACKPSAQRKSVCPEVLR